MPTLNCAVPPSSTARSDGWFVMAGGSRMARLNARLWPTLSLRLVNQTAALLVLAAEFKPIVTEPDGPPGRSAPPEDEAVSQAEVFDKVQFSKFVPLFVTEKTWKVTVKGPPTTPSEENPVPGMIIRGSGVARAL